MTDAPLEVVSRRGHPDFIDLPWDRPLEGWSDGRLVRMAHGLSRHVVRFVRYDDRVYAIKATDLGSARREYEMLGRLRAAHLPTVEPVGVVTGAAGHGAALITRYLDFSLPYWYVFGRDDLPAPDSVLRDAAVVLLVRLHLAGVFWGDCSLSNILFRRDAGALMAYLVDAETAEQRPSIGDALREHDLDLAVENIVGGLLNLQAEGRVDPELDVVGLVDRFRSRYDELWQELTGTDVVDVDERWRIERRVRHLNRLGFDVEELAIETTDEGRRLRITPRVVEEGHHARELQRHTGLTVQENQARRLLSDIANFGARLGQSEGRTLPEAVVAARWLAEVYEPIVSAIPESLRDRLEPAELFHQLLEHRYLVSARQSREVPNLEALDSLLRTVITGRPSEQLLGGADAGDR
ncbi:MAG: DUF4032 domain-containing protein [Acidimicrobiales bacterium]